MPIQKIVMPFVLAVLLAAQPLLVTAQKAPHGLPGYVVKVNGDTLRGLLEVPRLVTTNGLLFRATEPAPAQKFTVEEVRAFGFQNGHRFVRRTMAVRRNAETGVVDSATVFLQQLVAGYANFYRYDAPRRPSQDDDPVEATQYFLGVENSGLVQVRRATQQVALAAVFKDCPAVVAAVPRTLFDEYRLGSLVLRYNTECHAATPAHDHRLPEAPSTVQVLVSLRAGVQRGQLFYPSSDYLTLATAQATVLPAYGLELRLAYQGPWSLIAGVHYYRLRSEATQVQTAQLGTTNTGQLLSLPASVEVQSLQAPVLVRYTFGHAPLRPYLAAGPMFGMYISNQTTLSYTTLTRVGNTTTPYRNDVVTEAVQNPKSTSPTVSGIVRLGVQFKATARISPLLEAQYSAGSDSEMNPGVQSNFLGSSENLGHLHYRAFSLMAGLEF
jgi:hypothetical protein